MAKTNQQIIDAGNVIKNETVPLNNTAERIGTQFVDQQTFVKEEVIDKIVTDFTGGAGKFAGAVETQLLNNKYNDLIVDTISDRDSIPVDRRRIGMEVNVLENGVKYVLGSDLTTWGILVIEDFSGGAGKFAGAAETKFLYEFIVDLESRLESLEGGVGIPSNYTIESGLSFNGEISSVSNWTSQSYNVPGTYTVNTPVSDGMNYLLISIPTGKSVIIKDAIGNDVTSNFTKISGTHTNSLGGVNDVYRFNNQYFTGYQVTYIITIN